MISPSSSSDSASDVASSATSASSYVPHESPSAMKQRLLRAKQVIIDDMNLAVDAVTVLPIPATLNWEEREEIENINTQKKIAAIEPYIEALRVWKTKLSSEEQASLVPSKEDEAHAEERLALLLDENCYC